jgi:hypothetical protein
MLPSVVSLYLSYDGNLAVRPNLVSQLKPGARLVSRVRHGGVAAEVSGYRINSE